MSHEPTFDPNTPAGRAILTALADYQAAKPHRDVAPDGDVAAGILAGLLDDLGLDRTAPPPAQQPVPAPTREQADCAHTRVSVGCRAAAYLDVDFDAEGDEGVGQWPAVAEMRLLRVPVAGLAPDAGAVRCLVCGLALPAGHAVAEAAVKLVGDPDVELPDQVEWPT